MGIIGNRIARRREDRGWTQGQLATYAKVDRSYLSLIESGARTNVGSDHLKKIATALDTSLDYLVGRIDDPRPLAIVQSPQNQALSKQLIDLLADPMAKRLCDIVIEMSPLERAELYTFARYIRDHPELLGE